MPIRPTRTLLLASISLFFLVLINGCATTSKEEILPQDGPTMQETYERHFKRLNQDSIENMRSSTNDRGISPGNGDLHGYTRNNSHEIDNLFPRLPNPTLVMFTYPHLAGPDGNPVPGYATAFPMYEGVEYALPGEVPVSVESPKLKLKK
ncbi:TIGR03751 family conjugal transfer lipoprotein [bacterium endosymbiont of Escarpia laminata]|nr:MAG: TIGR03751 family conjugal transfer lipoprotein [bacterium endosymbiont of Escarpia laminata]